MKTNKLTYPSMPNHPRFINMTGVKIKRLTVLAYAGIVNRRTKWLCKCECGNLTIVHSDALRSNNPTESCGCAQNEGRNRKHGKNNTRAYSIWCAMHSRCSTNNACVNKDYAGRGITVCERWKDFQNFYDDMGDPPSADHSLDRIDNNKNYSPENCRWATRSEQNINKRVTIKVKYQGKTTALKNLAELHNIPYRRVYERIKYDKWDLVRALTTPVSRANSRRNAKVK